MAVDCRGTTTAPLVFHAKENVPGTYIGQVLPQNGTGAATTTRFFIVNQQDVPDISITEDGALYAPRGLDREARQNYSITVIAESPRGVGVFQVSFPQIINTLPHAEEYNAGPARTEEASLRASGATDLLNDAEGSFFPGAKVTGN